MVTKTGYKKIQREIWLQNHRELQKIRDAYWLQNHREWLQNRNHWLQNQMVPSFCSISTRIRMRRAAHTLPVTASGASALIARRRLMDVISVWTHTIWLQNVMRSPSRHTRSIRPKESGPTSGQSIQPKGPEGVPCILYTRHSYAQRMTPEAMTP